MVVILHSTRQVVDMVKVAAVSLDLDEIVVVFRDGRIAFMSTEQVYQIAIPTQLLETPDKTIANECASVS